MKTKISTEDLDTRYPAHVKTLAARLQDSLPQRTMRRVHFTREHPMTGVGGMIYCLLWSCDDDGKWTATYGSGAHHIAGYLHAFEEAARAQGLEL